MQHRASRRRCTRWITARCYAFDAPDDTYILDAAVSHLGKEHEFDAPDDT
jgi:hypothetical protein